MKVKNYILASFFTSVILTLCMISEVACVSKENRPNGYNSDSNSPKIPTDPIQPPSNGKKSGEGEDKEGFCEEKKTLTETYRLQYAQLLETHRVYFGALLFVLSTYLAVMGACLNIVCKRIGEINNGPVSGSKTLLFTLLIFALSASGIFMVGLNLGEKDAMKRAPQIRYVATQLDIESIKVEILEDLFRWIALGPVIIISLWTAILIRSIMIFANWQRPPRFMTIPSLIIGVIWILGSLLSYLIPSGLFRRIKIGSTIIVFVWLLVLFIIGVIICRQKEKTQ